MKKMISCFAMMLSLSFAVPWMSVTNAATSQAATHQTVTAMVNVNAASAKELKTLPGIGQVTAQRIIDYRTAKGPYASVEDLLKVKGLGQSTLQKIRDQIVLQ